MPTTADIQFERAGNSPRAWHLCAEQLLLAADELLASLDAQVAPVGLMLRGMAVECLLKAMWLKSGNKLAVDGRFKGIPRTGGHDLNQMATELRFERSEIEVDVLRRLKHFIEYGGRYPIPTRVEDLKLRQSPLGGKSVATIWSTPSDNLAFQRIVQRLEGALAG